MVKEFQSNINGIKVKDINGNVLRGALKTSSGSIIFTDDKSLNNYLTKKEKILSQNNQVQDLMKQIEELKKLIENKNG